MSEITEFLNQLMVEKPLLPLVIPLLLILWSIEKWFFNLSNWLPLAVAIWATIQVSSFLFFFFSLPFYNNFFFSFLNSLKKI